MLNETCTVRIATQSTDLTTGFGGSVAYTDTAGVACNIQQSGTSGAVEFGKKTGRRTYTGFFATGSGPQSPSDRVLWRGRTLECIGHPADASGRSHHEETILAEPADE